MSEGHSPRTNTRLCWLAFWVSAAVLAFQISLMRILLVASWSHFAFLVISVTLLGFGASGTALTLVRRWAMRHRDGTLLALSLLTAVSMPLCTTLAQFVPVEANGWDLKAIHHAGGEKVNGQWVNNQGVRMDRIVADLRNHFQGTMTGNAILAELGI